MLYFEVSEIYFRESRRYEGFLEVVFYNSSKQENIFIEGYNEIWHTSEAIRKEEYTKIDYPPKKLGIWKKKLIINEIRSSFYNGAFVSFDNGDILRIFLTDIQGEIEEIMRLETPANLTSMARKSLLEMFNNADYIVPSAHRSED
jgi:hypothetical protein